MTIIVQPGDCLWTLAKKHLGDGQRWKELWRINRETITAAQRRVHARLNMRGPDWIFPGTVLVVVPAGR